MARKRTGGGNEERRIALNLDQVRDLFNSGMTAIEIAVAVGCSAHPIKMALKKLCLRRPAKRRQGVGSGKNNPAWMGGRRIRTDGYVAVWTPDGERLEHQIVMERKIGRPLRDGEITHHIDRNKSNNDPENLCLTTRSDHIKEHLSEMHAARYCK